MQAYQPDWATKTLATLASGAYFGFLALAVLLLVGSLAARLVVGPNPNWIWGLTVPATVGDSPAPIQTKWGPAELEVKNVQGTLRLPLGMLPWRLVAILWTHAAAASALMIVALYQLRRLFHRVRDGAPFDADNARRLRWLGLSLLGLALVNGLAELVASLALRGLSASGTGVRVGMPIDGSLVFAALVLMALARIFHRGSDLEHDHSLVV